MVDGDAPEPAPETLPLEVEEILEEARPEQAVLSFGPGSTSEQQERRDLLVDLGLIEPAWVLTPKGRECLRAVSGTAPDDIRPAVPGFVPDDGNMFATFQPAPAQPESLRGVRIGKYGRQVLLSAAPVGAADADLWVPDAYSKDAVPRLRRAGLVATRRVQRRGTNMHGMYWSWPNGVLLTALGAAVVSVVGERLRDGRRIRWPRVLPAITAALAVDAAAEAEKPD
jgi:hypothetical protein